MREARTNEGCGAKMDFFRDLALNLRFHLGLSRLIPNKPSLLRDAKVGTAVGSRDVDNN